MIFHKYPYEKPSQISYQRTGRLVILLKNCGDIRHPCLSVFLCAQKYGFPRWNLECIWLAGEIETLSSSSMSMQLWLGGYLLFNVEILTILRNHFNLRMSYDLWSLCTDPDT